MKPKLKKVIAQPNNTSIIIYYSRDGEQMRFPTGIKISNKKTGKGKFIDWDYSRNLLKPSVSDFEELNNKIQNLTDKANRILSEFFFKKNITPSAAELMQAMLSEQKQIIKNNNAFIIELYQKFHLQKEEQFKANGTPISLKDYTSTLNLLIDFETHTEKRYRIYEFDINLWRSLLNFMKIAHLDNIEKGKVYKTGGLMNGKTCRKRFDIFVGFSEYLKDNKFVGQGVIEELKKFRKKEIKVPKTEKVTLQIDEIIALYDYKFSEKEDEIIKDVFVFLCFTGLRYQDYLKFDSNHIRKAKNSEDFIYVRKASKTKASSGLNYNIPMCDIAMEIIKKYGEKMPQPLKPNLQIKIALEKTKLFNQPTNIIDKNTKIEKLRFQFVSMHKGRDSFITNLVDVTPLNQLMKYTGHAKISTLQGYIDTSREVETTPIKIFNRK